VFVFAGANLSDKAVTHKIPDTAGYGRPVAFKALCQFNPGHGPGKMQFAQQRAPVELPYGFQLQYFRLSVHGFLLFNVALASRLFLTLFFN
jgi:hypothetical protein